MSDPRKQIVLATAALCSATNFAEVRKFVEDTNNRFDYDLTPAEVAREMKGYGKEVELSLRLDSILTHVVVEYPQTETGDVAFSGRVDASIVNDGNIEEFTEDLAAFVDDWKPESAEEKKAPKNNIRWGRKEIDRLRVRVNNGDLPYTELSEEWGRSVSSIRTMASKIRRGLA